jgi:enoyl-CoA hydratase/carnithine racemase
VDTGSREENASKQNTSGTAERHDDMTEHIIVDDEDSMRTITMRRPEKKNTLTQDMYLAMSDAIDTAQSNPAIRCLILTGRSGVFTAGNDIGDFLQAATAEYDVARPRNAVISCNRW